MSSCRALPVDLRQRLLEVVFLEAPLEGVVLPLREPLAIALVLLAQPGVLRRHALQTLCEHAVVAALGSLLTQPCLARLERDLDSLVARERLSRWPGPHPPGDPLDQCVPGELGACVPTVEYLDDRVHLRRG